MKRILFITLAVLLSTLSASAYNFKVNGIAYRYNGSNLSTSAYCYVVEGSDYKDVISIPSHVTYGGKILLVIGINNQAFIGRKSLTSVIIPNSVTSISDYAFYGCSGLRYMQLICTTPPSITSNSIPSGSVIYVPLGASDAYKKNAVWSGYTIMESTGTNVAMGNDKGGGSFGGSGSGTKDDPYLIFNPIQLHNIRNFTGYDDVYFKLMSDIDLTEFINDNSPTEGWEPIGSVQSPFMGNLDGDGHTISGIRIDRKADCVGFFSCVKNANISNLKFEGTTIKGNSHVGAFIGAADNSVINGVSASFHNVDGQNFTAGLIGSAQDGCRITSSQYAGAVNVAGDYVGGLVSWVFDNVSISKSTVNATSIVGKGDYVGGLVGFSIESNYADNSISANLISGSSNYTGGAIGHANGMTVSNSYAFVSNIKGGAYTGGFVGMNVQNSDNVSNCGVIANVTGTEYVGGFNGSFKGTANNVFAIGDITSTNSYCGGIAGETTNASISNSYFSGNINGGGDYVGGIAGYSEATAISKNYSYAAINGLQYVGGIAGNALGSSTIKSNVAAGEVVNAVNGKVGRVFGEKASTVTIGASGTADSNRGLTTMRIVSQGLQITPTDGEQHGSNLGKTLLKYKTPTRA